MTPTAVPAAEPAPEEPVPTTEHSVSAVAVHWMLSGYEIRQNVLVESSTLMVLGTMRELKARYSAA